jgi:hypothetical protein
MAIVFVMISFNEPIKTDNEDILNHLGFVREIAGKTDLNFLPHMWDLALDKLPFKAYGTAFRLLIDNYDVSHLTVIFENGLPKEHHADELFVRRRSSEIAQVIAWMMVNMKLNFQYDGITTLATDNDIIYEITADLGPMLEGMADSRRDVFTVVKDK